AMSSRLLAFTSFFLQIFSSAVEGTVIFNPIDGPVSVAVTGIEHYTTTEKELLAVVFSFDKFCPYLILSNTMVYTDHSALKYLLSKHDAKPRLIRWVLLLQGFNIEIKDKKRADYLAADHLSKLENPHMEVMTEREMANEFPDEHLMVLKSNLMTMSHDNIMRRCVDGSETLKILAHYHLGPTGEHHSALVTAKKVYESGFYWPSVFKDANEYIIRCDACQRPGNIYSRNEMPQNNIQVKAQALPTNDVRVVVKFLRGLFAMFGVPKALIIDRGTHFCNFQLEKALQKYGVTHKLSTAYHPQSNGQTKVTNRAIKCILERSVGYNHEDWSE
ncbi:reverse transcriptase domain-containing protein, partial [Tanacetum coccineum]